MSARTKAFVNLYAAMGTLSAYAKLDAYAKGIASEKDISVRFKVKDGPDGVLVFNGGKIEVVPYTEGVPFDIGLYASSNEKFNDLVDGKGSSVLPFKGLFKIGFLLNKNSGFNKLTGKMGDIMRKKDFDDDEERKLSTLLAFNAMAAAIVAIGNEDKIGQLSAARIPEGNIGLEIKNVAAVSINSKKVNGKTVLTFIPEKTVTRCRMVFDSLETAKGVIDGKLDAMGCIAEGKIAMSGYIPMVQHMNNILNLVPKYLA